jgi:hypothetical protein
MTQEKNLSTWKAFWTFGRAVDVDMASIRAASIIGMPALHKNTQGCILDACV